MSSALVSLHVTSGSPWLVWVFSQYGGLRVARLLLTWSLASKRKKQKLSVFLRPGLETLQTPFLSTSHFTSQSKSRGKTRKETPHLLMGGTTWMYREGRDWWLAIFGNHLPQALSLRTVVRTDAVIRIVSMAKSGTVSWLLLDGVSDVVQVVSCPTHWRLLVWMGPSPGQLSVFPVSVCHLHYPRLRPSEVTILVMPIVIECILCTKCFM